MKKDLNFYPVITAELEKASSLHIGKYVFGYKRNGIPYSLKSKGTSVIKISDPDDYWDSNEDGFSFDKDVVIEYPSFLYGPNGIACKGSEIGVCILWKNQQLTLAGCITPEDDESHNVINAHFHHEFKPGEVDGAIELTICLYLKKIAPQPSSDEKSLINEAGVILGEIEIKVIDINSSYMEFPIVEVDSPDEPLWWVSFSDWEDPTASFCEFSEENICIYLNKHYPSCPMTDGSIKNIDMLIDILASVYTMIFKKLIDRNYYDRTINNSQLAENSICKVMYDFYDKCEYPIRTDSLEGLHKSLQINLRDRLMTNTEEE